MVDIAGSTATTATFEGDPGQIATFSGELETPGDTDWIRVTLQQGVTYQFFGSVVAAGANLGNSIITLRDAGGLELFSNDDEVPGSTANSYIFYTAPTSGTYFVEIEDKFNRLGEYGLAVTLTDTRSRLTRNADTYSGGLNNIIIGDQGDDSIDLANAGLHALGEQGDDSISGDASANFISGGPDNDSLSGNDGNDRLFGDNGRDQLVGGNHEDLLYGGAGVDFLLGASGNDEMFTGEGGDRSEGDFGDDIFHVDNALDFVAEFGGRGTDTVLTTVTYALAAGQEIEVLKAELPTSTAALNLSGNEFANALTGNNGANVLYGAAGTDVLRGLFGNDIYVLQNGNDVVIDLGGVDTITSTITRSLASYAGIERLTLAGTAAINGTGNAFANVIVANAAANVLNGLGGNDTLSSGAGNDTLLGGIGNDMLVGGAGHDRLSGEAGNDRLVGGIGNDRIAGGTGIDWLTGQAGFDLFVFDGAPSAANRDIVTDFFAPHDTFQLDNAVFAKLGANGALNPLFFKLTTQVQDANDFIRYNKAAGALFYDANGNGAGGAILLATLSNKPSNLAANDFVVI